MNRAANLHEVYVQDFCKQVTSSSLPVELACEPAPGAQLLDCFSTVESQVQKFGGRPVLGWAIWEFPQVLIEAEFHAVWERHDDGVLIDISAHPLPFSKITFLPDPQRVYLGRQVDNIRKPLSKDPKVRQFIYLMQRQFEILNRGSRADQYEVDLPKKERKEYALLLKQLQVLGKQIFR